METETGELSNIFVLELVVVLFHFLIAKKQLKVCDFPENIVVYMAPKCRRGMLLPFPLLLLLLHVFPLAVPSSTMHTT